MDARIKEIISNFDFQRVHDVMKHLKWKWAFINTESGIPSVGDLMIVSQSLLERVSENKDDYYFIGTGGLIAEKIGNDFRLSFVLEDWRTEADDE